MPRRRRGDRRWRRSRLRSAARRRRAGTRGGARRHRRARRRTPRGTSAEARDMSRAPRAACPPARASRRDRGGLVGRRRPARRLARAAIQRRRAVERACGAARVGGAKEQIGWSSRCRARRARCSAGSRSPAAMSARIDSRVGEARDRRLARGRRSARSPRSRGSCRAADSATRPLNQRLAFGGCRGGRGKSRFLALYRERRPMLTTSSRAPKSFHPFAVSSS